MKVGDLVKIKEDEGFDDSGLIGIVQWVDNEYPGTCEILFSDESAVYCQHFAEVISECR